MTVLFFNSICGPLARVCIRSSRRDSRRAQYQSSVASPTGKTPPSQAAAPAPAAVAAEQPEKKKAWASPTTASKRMAALANLGEAWANSTGEALARCPTGRPSISMESPSYPSTTRLRLAPSAPSSPLASYHMSSTYNMYRGCLWCGPNTGWTGLMTAWQWMP